MKKKPNYTSNLKILPGANEKHIYIHVEYRSIVIDTTEKDYSPSGAVR